MGVSLRVRQGGLLKNSLFIAILILLQPFTSFALDECGQVCTYNVITVPTGPYEYCYPITMPFTNQTLQDLGCGFDVIEDTSKTCEQATAYYKLKAAVLSWTGTAWIQQDGAGIGATNRYGTFSLDSWEDWADLQTETPYDDPKTWIETNYPDGCPCPPQIIGCNIFIDEAVWDNAYTASGNETVYTSVQIDWHGHVQYLGARQTIPGEIIFTKSGRGTVHSWFMPRPELPGCPAAEGYWDITDTNVSGPDIYFTENFITAWRNLGDLHLVTPVDPDIEYPNGCSDFQKTQPYPDKNKGCGGGYDNSTQTSNPINFATGNKYKRQVDFAPNRPALPISFVRHYNSQNESATGFGYGWTTSYSQHLTFETGKIILHQDDANQVHFIDDAQGSYVNEAGKLRTIIPITGGYELSEPDGRKLTFDTLGALTQIGDRNNNTLTLTYDINGKLQSVADNFGYQIDFAYDVNGRLETLITPAGNYTYTYDVNGNLATMTNPALTGKTYLYEDVYDTHNLTGIINENGTRIETYTYNNQDQALTSKKAGGLNKVTITYNTDLSRIVTDSTGKATTFELEVTNGIAKVKSSTGDGCASCVADTNKSFVMDDRMQVTQETNANGTVTNYTYDSRGNVLTKTEAVGTPEERATTYTWHAEYNVPLTITMPSVSNPGQNKVTTFTYDTNGNMLTKTVDGFSGTTPISATWTYTYNTDFQLVKVDGPRSDINDSSDIYYYHLDSLEINDRGQILTFFERLFTNEIRFQDYNAFGKPTTVKHINNSQSILTYDVLGRLVTNNTAGKTTTYNYDNAGNMTSIILPGGKTITYTYTPANLLEKITDTLSNSITYTYDTEGKRIGEDVKDASSVLTKYVEYAYDNQNRLWKMIYPGGTIFDERLYDLEDNLAQFKDANGNITTYDYDVLDRITTTAEPGATITSMAYDAHDNLVSVTDAENKATTYVYDDFGNVISDTFPDSGTTTYIYDVASNMTSKTDAKGVTVSYTYDLLNRLTNINLADPTRNITYIYDRLAYGENNKLTRINDPSGETAYVYDSLERVSNQTTTLDGIAYTLSYTYDDNGDLATVTYPSGTVITYVRDAAGQVTDVTRTVDTVTTSLASGITHLPFGPANSITLGNGLVVSRAFDQQYRLEGSQAGSLYSKTYTYDNVGNILDSNDLLAPAKTEIFGYDTLYRLTSATGEYGGIDYTYDKVGNRLTKTKDLESDIYNYELGTNRLLSITGTNPLEMSYDEAGNVTARGLRTMTYNDNNRLIQSIEGSKVEGEYTYNGLGQRVKKVAGNSTTYYLFDRAGNLMAEMDNRGNILQEYVYMDGELLALIDQPGSNKEAVYYYLNDHLTSPNMLTDASGALAWQGDREPFGASTLTLEDVTNNFRFPGQYYDEETGLHYNWHRYYDPQTGRYLRTDPLGLGGGDINIYLYAGGNPVNYTDSQGLFLDGDKYAKILTGSAGAVSYAEAAAATSTLGTAALYTGGAALALAGGYYSADALIDGTWLGQGGLGNWLYDKIHDSPTNDPCAGREKYKPKKPGRKKQGREPGEKKRQDKKKWKPRNPSKEPPRHTPSRKN